MDGGEEQISLVRALPLLDGEGRVQQVVSFFRAVADLAVPRLADWCVIDLLAEDGKLQRVATAHVDPAKVKLLDDLQRRWPWSAAGDLGPGRVLRTREPPAISEPSGEELAAETHDEEHLRVLLEVGVTSMLSAAVEARGRVLGAITLGTGASGRRLRDEDLDLVLDLAARAGIAIDNARLFEVQQARAEAERAVSTLRRLEQVAQAALAHSALDDLLPALLEQIVELLAADTAAILLLDERSRELRVRATVGLGEELKDAVPVPLGQGMAGRVAATGTAVVIDDLDEIELVSPVLRARGITSLVAIPLVVEARVIGVAHAGSEKPGHFSRSDVGLLELIADRIALAINQVALFEAEREAQERLTFLAEASSLLASSLDYEHTLSRVAELAVPRLCDWCTIDMKAEDGSIRRLAAANVDPARLRWAWELYHRYPPQPRAAEGIGKVLETGRPELVPEVTPELRERWASRFPDAGDVISELGLQSYMIVPFAVRGCTLGSIMLAWAEGGRHYGESDLELAEDLARRASVAIDNAQLYRQAEERGQAARVLAAVGEGVLLVDSSGIVRYWNRAAEAITGIPRSAIVDRPAAEAIPGWQTVAERLTIAADPVSISRAESLPLGVGKRELWISISGAAVVDGTVYMFRDLSEERALDALKAEFVSAVSHELRTPLAAVYGAAMTLRRDDVALGGEQRAALLAVISNESDRLARTVNAILWASRLDTDALATVIERCDALALATDVVAAQRAHLPSRIALELEADGPLPAVAADPDKIRQVLVNLVDNAVK